MLNARIRKRWRMGSFPIGLIGERADLTYHYDYLGAGPETLAEVAAGRGAFAEILKKAAAPADHRRHRQRWRGRTARRSPRSPPRSRSSSAAGGRLERLLGPAHRGRAGRRARLRLRARPGGLTAGEMAAAGALDVVFLLGADEIEIAPGAFVVYIGTHGDRGAHRADVILPGAAYPEKSAIYVNTEGRVQMAGRASFPPGDAREDWAILRALSDVLGRKLPYDSLRALRAGAVRGASASAAHRPDRAGEPAMCGRWRPWAAPSSEAPFGVGDRGLLSHQSDRARVRGHGRMLGARRGQRRADRGGVGDRMAEFWTSYIWPLLVIVAQSVLLLVLLLIDHRLRAASRPQDLGGGADQARTERGRPLGTAAVLRRPPQIRASRSRSFRPAPTRACSCWRRSSPACSRSPPGR